MADLKKLADRKEKLRLFSEGGKSLGIGVINYSVVVNTDKMKHENGRYQFNYFLETGSEAIQISRHGWNNRARVSREHNNMMVVDVPFIPQYTSRRNP